MNMAKKMLTVIIPTWNRCEYLKKNLDILLPLAELHKEDVSVYISDNASDDDTPLVIEETKKSYPKLVTSFRQETNIGSARNFTDSISKIDSEYFVLLGDDDYIMPIYFDYVLRILKEHPDVDWLCYNGTRFKEDNCLLSPLTTKRVDNHEKFYKNGAEMVMEFTNSITLMSQNIYRRKLFNEAMECVKEETYPGYSWYATMCKQIVGKPSYHCDINLIENYCQSAVNWSHNLPLYHIYSLGKLFSQMEERCEGLYAAWMRTLNDQKEIRRIILDVMNRNRSLYRKKIKDMQKYTCSVLYAKQMYIYTMFPKGMAKILDKLLKGYSLLNKRMRRPLEKPYFN